MESKKLLSIHDILGSFKFFLQGKILIGGDILLKYGTNLTKLTRCGYYILLLLYRKFIEKIVNFTKVFHLF